MTSAGLLVTSHDNERRKVSFISFKKEEIELQRSSLTCQCLSFGQDLSLILYQLMLYYYSFRP